MDSLSKKIHLPLLLLSRVHLDEEQGKLASQLIKDVDNWDLFISIARRKLGSPIIYRNLGNLKADLVRKEVLRDMHQHAQSSAFRMLTINAATISFHKKCIEPFSAKHFYIKGPSLWARYYEKKDVRNCRDIDVVVHKKFFKSVVESAHHNGYQIISEATREPIYPDQQYLNAILRYQNVVSMVSPEGVLIEVHKKLDKSMGIFSSEDMFNDLEQTQIGGRKISVLPTQKLFVYICYHSTQHLWSHLTWMADFDAIIHHDTFDRAEALEYADMVGLRRLVVGCLSFYEMTGRAGLKRDLPEAALAERIFEKCVLSLSGDLENEHEMIRQEWRRGHGKRYAGSLSFSVRTSINGYIAMFQPQIWQYEVFPLPVYLHWLYYPMMAIYYFQRLLRKGFGRKQAVK